jgi:hypothetical protein
MIRNCVVFGQRASHPSRYKMPARPSHDRNLWMYLTRATNIGADE